MVNSHDIAVALTAASAQRERIAGKLGLPEGYYQRMSREGSDWEFTIKLVVLLEAALGHVIAATLQNAAVRDHCERLSLDGRSGKLKLAEALGVLSKAEREAFERLAQIRNSFAHRVENIDRSLADYAQTLDPGVLAELCEKLFLVPEDMRQQMRALFTPQWVAGQSFRSVLSTAGAMLLHTLATGDVRAEAEAQRRQNMETAAGRGAATLEELFAGLGAPADAAT